MDVPLSLATAPEVIEGPAMAEDPDQLTIDQLTAQSRVPSRTIRYYQSKGVLPPPEIKGRVAYYGPLHLERLLLIAKLQDRGLRIDAIRALLSRIEKRRARRRRVARARRRAQGVVGRRSAAHGRPRPSCTSWSAPSASGWSPISCDCVRSSAPATSTSSAARRCCASRCGSRPQASISRPRSAPRRSCASTWAAPRAISRSTFFAQAEHGRVQPPAHGNWARVFEELRPTSIEAVRVIFGQQMERVLRELIEEGATAKLPGRKKRR